MSFSLLGSACDYRHACPVTEYKDYEKYIFRILNSEENVISSSPVYKMVSSSGSSGQVKILPMTWDYVRAAFAPFYALCIESLKDAYATYLKDDCVLNLKADPLRAKPLLSNGMEHLGLSQINFSQDFDSMEQEPGAQSSWVRISPEVDSEVDRLVAKIIKSAGGAVTTIVGINPRTVLNVALLIKYNPERIIEAVATGMINNERIAAPNPDLADAMRRVFLQKNTLLPLDIWPSLRLVVCWLEGAASIYLAYLREIYGPSVTFADAPLGSSEAPVAVPLYDGKRGGLLAYDTIFYEFLPINQNGLSETHLAHELQIGQLYSTIITQQSGLYRYHLKDVLKVEGAVNGIPRVTYQGRLSEGSVYQDHHLLDAMSQAALTSPVVSFTSASVNGELNLFIEFGPGQSEERKTKSAMVAGSLLQSANAENQVNVYELPEGAFHAEWLKRLQEGHRAPQVKDIPVQKSMKYLDVGKAKILFQSFAVSAAGLHALEAV